jgi:ABC-type nickel/cobalt efflux system permease component RcnA
VAIVGVLALLFREALPLEAIASWSERLVGVMLVAIGIWAIRKAMKLTIHVHEHEHDGSRHVHIHAHGPGHAHDSANAHTHSPHTHSHVPVGIGMLHGLAGSSHFLGVLPMLALPTVTDAILYLGAFTIGTIASMAFFSVAVGYASRRCAKRGERFYRGFMSLSGVAALVVGCAWMLMSLPGA